MVYYFSGTGNSRYVAETLAHHLGEEAASLVGTFPTEGSNVIVFPIYSWGVPPIVVKYLQHIPLAALPKWAVMVCGDETGRAPEMLKKLYKKRDASLLGLWSIQMPNNYVLLPGFDVDSKEVERRKLQSAPARIKEIAAGIRSGEEVEDVFEGPWPRLKTALVYPLFKRWGIQPMKWRCDENCIGCGLCAKACPVGNIQMTRKATGERPRWGKNCTSCLACYHVCPRHSVGYGNATRKKGQYKGPKN